MKDYQIKGSILTITTSKGPFQIDISKPDEENIAKIKSNIKSNNNAVIALLIISMFPILLGLLSIISSYFLLNIIFSFVIVVLAATVMNTHHAYKMEKEENALYEQIFGHRMYQILRELYVGEQRLQKEQQLLGKLNKEIEKLKNTFEANDSSFTTPNERKLIKENLEHLRLRKQLREAKVKFFDEYLKKWRIKQALNDAEETILKDLREEGEASSRQLLNVKAEKEQPAEDILMLRPLSERMELCESKEEAFILLNELKELAV